MANWKDIIGPLKNTENFKHAYAFQKARRDQGVTVFPPQKDIFNAFAYTPFDKLKVVILGQDPYQTPGFAMGLSFSVNVGIEIPLPYRTFIKN